jgi:hypothetical protein
MMIVLLMKADKSVDVLTKNVNETIESMKSKDSAIGQIHLRQN